MHQALEDDNKDSVSLLVKMRLPWLTIGLVGGLAATILSSKFEHVLSQNISIAYFIPIVVYMADAVGTQTENVYVRNLGTGRVKLSKYIAKELFLGVFLGTIFGVVIGGFAYAWLGNIHMAITVGLAFFATMTTAPVISLLIPAFLNKVHDDPAIGAGPITTVIQDLLSISIYFIIATIIML